MATHDAATCDARTFAAVTLASVLFPQRELPTEARGCLAPVGRVRHEETNCTGPQRNGPNQSEEGIGLTGAQVDQLVWRSMALGTASPSTRERWQIFRKPLRPQPPIPENHLVLGQLANGDSSAESLDWNYSSDPVVAAAHEAEAKRVQERGPPVRLVSRSIRGGRGPRAGHRAS